MKNKKTKNFWINLGFLSLFFCTFFGCGQDIDSTVKERLEVEKKEVLDSTEQGLFTTVVDSTEWSQFKAIFDIAPIVSTMDSVIQELDKDKVLEIKKQSLFARINGIDPVLYQEYIDPKKGQLIWDSLANSLAITFDTTSTIRNPKYQVFGWHPFWMKGAYKRYNFDLLSHVSWFSYDIDAATGSYDNPEVITQLREDGVNLISQAHEKNCKVLLTITNHGYEKNRVFLQNNQNQQEALIDSLIYLLDALDLDGIDVNFELLPKGYGTRMFNFLKELSVRIKSADPNYTFCITIPKVNRNQYPNIERLNEQVDYFLLTGYDFHTGGSRRDGPIAPLFARKGKRSLQTVVADYLEQGVLKEKLVLGLPYYGGNWKSGSPNMKDTDRSFSGHLTYRYIMAKYNHQRQVNYDTLSHSAYFLNPLGQYQYEKIWFDDSLTLKTKFDWAKEKELAGIGIWALGYDNGRNELWGAIDQTFSADSLVNIPIETNFLFKTAAIMSNYEDPLLLSIVFLSFFCGLGFLIALFDWRVRDYLFNSDKSRLMTALCSIGFLLVVYAVFFGIKSKGFVENEGSTLLLGMLIGALITSLVFWWGNRRSRFLP